MTPKVSSRWASYDGGSDGTAKISSPPMRGLSWAAAGAAASATAMAISRRTRCRMGHLHSLGFGSRHGLAPDHDWSKLARTSGGFLTHVWGRRGTAPTLP